MEDLQLLKYFHEQCQSQGVHRTENIIVNNLLNEVQTDIILIALGVTEYWIDRM